MKLSVGALAVTLMAGGLITWAPPASAGCLYGGPVISKCDGPFSPDGTWERLRGGFQPRAQRVQFASGARQALRCDGSCRQFAWDFRLRRPTDAHIDDLTGFAARLLVTPARSARGIDGMTDS